MDEQTNQSYPQGEEQGEQGGPEEDLKKKLEICEKEKAEYLLGWQRSRADLLNYKKEELERMRELIEAACETLLLKILPILDNLEIGEKNLPEELKQNENVKGLLQMKSQLQNFLKSQNVEGFESVGKKHDPFLQEAIEVVEGTGVESGTVLEETQKGYKIQDRLLRPAKVKVAK
ncbi:MAG: nucleotide exchange factor GrpE [Patescibacteria group bacterium]